MGNRTIEDTTNIIIAVETRVTLVAGGFLFQALHDVAGNEGKVEVEYSNLTETLNEDKFVETGFQERQYVGMLASVFTYRRLDAVQHVGAGEGLTVTNPGLCDDKKTNKFNTCCVNSPLHQTNA